MSFLLHNKKAGFNYEILDTFEAGIELLGFEVKSLRNKRGSLEGSFVMFKGGEVYLAKCNIPPFQENNTPKEYDPYRSRKLLLTKKEIREIIGKSEAKGLTIVPISVYNKKNKIKVQIAVVKGKKTHDKRESIKKRETEREIRRTLKEH